METRVIKKVILMGRGASGKDYAKNMLINFGFNSEISYTTRQPRSREVQGETYHFISENRFLEKLNNKDFIQWNMLNGSAYGTDVNQYANSNLFIMTPNILKSLDLWYSENNVEKDYMVIYFDIDMGILQERLHKRGFTKEEIISRTIADDRIFTGFEGYDKIITEPNFNDVQLLNLIFSPNSNDGNIHYDTTSLRNEVGSSNI